MSAVSSGFRLFVDLQTIQNAFHPADRGIPRYASEFARTLIERRPDTKLALSPFQPWPASLLPDLAAAPQLVLNTPQELRAAMTEGPLAYLVMSPFELSRPVHGVLPPHVLETGVPMVCVLYDLIPDVLGVYDAAAPELSAPYHHRRESVRGYDLFLALSEHTRGDAVERLGIAPERVVVIGAGVSGYFHQRARHAPMQTAASRIPRITRPFVFTVSGYAPHKNTETLIDAWALLPRAFRQSYQLVVTCAIPPDGPALWMARAQSLDLAPDDIVYTGYVPDSTLRSLYQAAELFVLPSLYEGFGLPVLEAVRCGAPAITSDASSLPEVLDYPPATFPPHDATALAALIERAVVDGDCRRGLKAAGERAVERHTWERVVDRSLGALALLPAPRRNRRPPRLRIALVGALPPSPADAVAAFNEALAGELARQAHVDCFSDVTTDGHQAVRPYARFPASALGVTFDPAAYDAVIYAIGDGPEHIDTYERACTFPGIVWLHDTSLASLQLARAWKHGDESAARQFMADLIGHLGYLPPMTPDDDNRVLDLEGYRVAETRLARELLAMARGCIVGSPDDHVALRIDAGTRVVMPPTWVVAPPATERRPMADLASEVADIVRGLPAASARIPAIELVPA